MIYKDITSGSFTKILPIHLSPSIHLSIPKLPIGSALTGYWVLSIHQSPYLRSSIELVTQRSSLDTVQQTMEVVSDVTVIFSMLL